MTGPELPRAIALVTAQAALPNASGNLTLVEVGNLALTWEFPNALPPFVVVAILVGGRPGVVYTTRFQIVGPSGEVLGDVAGGDAPFTTQITRVNVLQGLSDIAPGPVVQGAGIYTIRLLVNGTQVQETDLDIRAVPPPALPTS